jgi:hypothetical protein
MAKAKQGTERWVQHVKTVSTFPPKGLFTKSAKTIAKAMSSQRISPNGRGSGIRMVQDFINRAAKNLTAEQKDELEKAKRLLQAKVRKERKTIGRRSTDVEATGGVNPQVMPNRRACGTACHVQGSRTGPARNRDASRPPVPGPGRIARRL